jgi:acetylglutamate kinase
MPADHHFTTPFLWPATAPAFSAIAQRLSALRGRPLVIKFGGSVQDDPTQTASIIDDLATLAKLGLRPVVIHGGGKAISAAMTAAGLQSRFIAGQRYTDAPALAIAERVLAGDINRGIVEALAQRGVPATSLTTLGACVLHATRTGATDEQGHPIDLGLVGRVHSVRTDIIDAVLAAGHIPVIAPVAIDLDPANPTGRLNVNADYAAGEVARALHPRGFILVSDTPGIRRIATDPASCAQRLSISDIAELRRTKVIDGGMIPKVEACLMAFDPSHTPHTHHPTNPADFASTPHVAITDGRVPHGLLAATLGQPGQFPGTLITRN